MLRNRPYGLHVRASVRLADEKAHWQELLDLERFHASGEKMLYVMDCHRSLS
jgi:hypothetical protein